MAIQHAPGRLEADFPDWHFYTCVADHRHAAYPGSPRIDVHGGDWDHLREKITRAELMRLEGYWRIELAARQLRDELEQRRQEQARFDGPLPGG